MDPNVILAALLGAIVWNLITWYLGLPDARRATRCIGGLRRRRDRQGRASARCILGGWVKPILFIFISPLLGMALALGLTVGLSWLLQERVGPARWTRSSAGCSSSRRRSTR